MSEQPNHQQQEKYAYISTLIEVRDRVHELLIHKSSQHFKTLMMSQNEHLVKHLRSSSSTCCLKEIDLITPDILGCLAATRYRLLSSVSEYELVNIIARAICELEIEETMVADILFETCMYFYTQKKLMKMLRLSSLEQRLLTHSDCHKKTLSWVKQQQELVFTTDDKEDLLFYSRMPA